MIAGRKPPGKKLKAAADLEAISRPMRDNLIPFPPSPLQPGAQPSATRTVVVRLGGQCHVIDITYAISKLPPEAVAGTPMDLGSSVPDGSEHRLHLAPPPSAPKRDPR